MASLIKNIQTLKSKDLTSNLKDKFEQTSLYYTCREGKDLCPKYLIQECNLNIIKYIDVYSQILIYYWIRDHKLEKVKLMIVLGSNIEDKYGPTCFFYSIREGNIDIIELCKCKPSR